MNLNLQTLNPEPLNLEHERKEEKDIETFCIYFIISVHSDIDLTAAGMPRGYGYSRHR